MFYNYFFWLANTAGFSALFTTTVISRMACTIGVGEWSGCMVGRWTAGGKQLEAGYTFHKDTDSSAVSSLSDRNKYNSQHRPRQLLAAVWPIHTLVNVTHWLHRPCSAPSWFDRVSEKPAMPADLAVSTHMLCVSG